MVDFESEADARAFDTFFANREASRRLFMAIAEVVHGVAPVVITATKSRACLKAATRFLYCPHAHVDGHAMIRFILPYPVQSPRLRLDALGNRWSHRIKLQTLDDEAVGWFVAARLADEA